ncbi:hypothetical protein NM208_g5653 [Fusarium decemcellulare]|uniref:Uncharacterized protein n=1 Tax=Fusarium decemcellulare TaxID=57161 RepID=A0ACC1SGG0_9HYPO|nr:hypothetical protein NM208_g5653 [Fusarium decemcellulare]
MSLSKRHSDELGSPNQPCPPAGSILPPAEASPTSGCYPSCISVEDSRSAVSNRAELAIIKLFEAVNNGFICESLDWETLRHLIPNKESLDEIGRKPILDLAGLKRVDVIGNYCRNYIYTARSLIPNSSVTNRITVGFKDLHSWQDCANDSDCGKLIMACQLDPESFLGASYILLVESSDTRRRVVFKQRKFCHFDADDCEDFAMKMLRRDINCRILQYNFDLAVWMAKYVIYRSQHSGKFQFFESFEEHFEALWYSSRIDEEI